MSLRSAPAILLDLDLLGREIGRAAAGHILKTECVAEHAADLFRFLRTVAVDAQMTDLKAEQAAPRILAECGDLFKTAAVNVALGADPASASRIDKGRTDVLGNVIDIQSAGRDVLLLGSLGK